MGRQVRRPGPGALRPARRGRSRSQLKVVTFNVQHGAAPGGTVDIGALARWCAGLEADVLALQEVDVGMARSGRIDTMAAVASAAEMDAVFGPALSVGRGRYGNALLVRGLVEHHEVVPLPGPGSAEPRVMIVAEVTVAGARLQVVATHLSPRDPEEQLDVVAATAASMPDPVIVLGDLNTGPAVVVPVLARHGLSVVGGEQPTFPAAAPRARIDHIAVRGLRCEASRVLPRAPVSDHLAVAADVDF